MFYLRKFTTRGYPLTNGMLRTATALVSHVDAALVSIGWEPNNAYVQWDDSLESWVCSVEEHEGAVRAYKAFPVRHVQNGIGDELRTRLQTARQQIQFQLSRTDPAIESYENEGGH